LVSTVEPAQPRWFGLDLFSGGVRTDVPQPVKPFATIVEQIDVLASRGLALDAPAAELWLRSVGYYRLSGYWYPYREVDDSRWADRRDRFASGASFDEVARLYEFDRKLRSLIHDGIERVEVALRSHIA